MDYDKLVETSQYDYKIKAEMTDICLQFVIAKKLIVFGGLAIDFSLKKNKCGGIYEDYQLMDIDVFSNRHYDDAHELLELFISKGYTNCDLMVAMHPTSVRVRIDHYMLLDVAYAPDNIYELYSKTALLYPTDYGNVLFRHPYIQILDVHRSFSYPYENKPLENIKNRFYKDYERYLKLIDCYPFDDKNIKYISFVTESGISSNVSKESNKYTEHTIEKDYYIHGIIAYMFYEQIFSDNINDTLIKNKGKLDLDNNTVKLRKGFQPLYMVTHIQLDTLVGNAGPDQVEHYYKYMDIIPEITKIGKIKYFTVVPGNEPGFIEYKGYKIISIHFVMLWLLHIWLVKKNNIYIEMYRNLFNMTAYISKKNDFEGIVDNEILTMFFPSIKVEFLDEEITVVAHEEGDVPTNIYFNKIEGKKYEFASFNYKGKRLFQIDGKRIPK